MTSLTVTTSPVISGRTGHHDVEALVEHDLGAAVQELVVDVGMQGHAHLSPTGQDVDGVVVVLADHDPVGGRRLRQLVDLVAQGGDVFAGLTERVRQLLVLADCSRELPLGLEQALLERVHPLGGIGETHPQVGDLLLQCEQFGVRVGGAIVTIESHEANVHARDRSMFARACPCKLRSLTFVHCRHCSPLLRGAH